MHDPLSATSPQIEGGSFDLLTVVGLVTGSFDSPAQAQAAGVGDSITLVCQASGCRNQQYRVVAGLNHVGTGSTPTGTGSFSVLLTHYRYWVPFVGCVAYFAIISGSITLVF